MGFWISYYSQFFKGPTATWWKSRVNVGKAERYGKQITKLLKKGIPEMEKRHLVSKFLKELAQIVNEIKKAGHSAAAVLFNELTQDLTEEKDIQIIINSFHKYFSKLPREAQELIKKYFAEEAKNIDEERKREDKEYWAVEALVVDTQKYRTDKEALMIKVRALFKAKAEIGSSLERIAWRRSLSASRKDISKTKNVGARIEATLKALVKHYSDKQSRPLEMELENELQELGKDIADMFHESYLVKERAILFILKLIYHIDQIDLKLQVDEKRHLVPKSQIDEDREHVRVIIEGFGHELHNVIEQGFRISIKRLGTEEKEFFAFLKS